MNSQIVINNTQLGEITVDPEKVVDFKDGLIGFEGLKKFAIIDLDEYQPFQWLLSIEDPDLTFPIISPILIAEEYSPAISRAETGNLGDFKDEDLLIYAIVTIRPEINKVTANLKGPILINQKSNLGQQVVLQDDEYSTNQEFISIE